MFGKEGWHGPGVSTRSTPTGSLLEGLSYAKSPTSYAPISLDVPYMSQGEAAYGCGPTCGAMVRNHFRRQGLYSPGSVPPKLADVDAAFREANRGRGRATKFTPGKPNSITDVFESLGMGIQGLRKPGSEDLPHFNAIIGSLHDQTPPIFHLRNRDGSEHYVVGKGAKYDGSRRPIVEYYDPADEEETVRESAYDSSTGILAHPEYGDRIISNVYVPYPDEKWDPEKFAVLNPGRKSGLGAHGYGITSSPMVPATGAASMADAPSETYRLGGPVRHSKERAAMIQQEKDAGRFINAWQNGELQASQHEWPNLIREVVRAYQILGIPPEHWQR